MGWTNPHVVALFRTSRGVSDLSTLFCHPTAPHLAAFYLAIARPAACFPPSLRDPSPNCDRTKNQTKHAEYPIDNEFVLDPARYCDPAAPQPIPAPGAIFQFLEFCAMLNR
jgi:hypothetical protein